MSPAGLRASLKPMPRALESASTADVLDVDPRRCTVCMDSVRSSEERTPTRNHGTETFFFLRSLAVFLMRRLLSLERGRRLLPHMKILWMRISRGVPAKAVTTMTKRYCWLKEPAASATSSWPKKRPTMRSSTTRALKSTVTRCLLVSSSPGRRASHQQREDRAMRAARKSQPTRPSSLRFHLGTRGSRSTLRSLRHARQRPTR
mmetsp:Transcript_11441/g.33953  ORF Transcript_11441/g.33953 Transcript_11441/m.33953 type:complete len:204 (+) Transcript_11441:3198-3809(+)